MYRLLLSALSTILGAENIVPIRWTTKLRPRAVQYLSGTFQMKEPVAGKGAFR